MKHIARCDSLSADREAGADPKVVEAAWRTLTAAFGRAGQEAHAALHPPSPTKN